MTYTTIRLDRETLKRLASLREYGRETYDEVINRLVIVFEKLRGERELSKETLEDIKKAREDYKKGRVLTTKQLLRELGVE